MYLEKFVARAKHVEAQIFGDGKGGILALGLRDCSAQRRHQKVIEETPAPGLDAATGAAMRDSAVLLGKAVNYASAAKLTLEIEAEALSGFNEEDVGVVRDNTKQLKFLPGSTGFSD